MGIGAPEPSWFSPTKMKREIPATDELGHFLVTPDASAFAEAV
jgi:hypothetical protein